MDHFKLASQLIGRMRAGRSQAALSRRLLRKSNVVYTWEAGRRFPTAAVFFRYAELVRVDVAAGIGRFLGSLPDELANRDFRDPETTARLLRHLREGTTLAELARKLGTNRVSVGRWLKGEAEPRLPDLLRLIEATSLRLLDFIDVFVSPAQLPETRDAWTVLEAQRRLAYSLPWSHAVLRVLELRDYREQPRPRDAFIAERLGISHAEAQRCLKALADSKLIARRAGRWVVKQVLAVDTRRNPEAGRTLKTHWAGVGLERLPQLEPEGQDLFSYNLFTVSEKDWERLRELHIAYFQELRRIVGGSQPAERVALVNLQLMRLDVRAAGGVPVPDLGSGARNSV
jgi:transcriptional regulator with XRE-family HTH domain